MSVRSMDSEESSVMDITQLTSESVFITYLSILSAHVDVMDFGVGVSTDVASV